MIASISFATITPEYDQFSIFLFGNGNISVKSSNNYFNEWKFYASPDQCHWLSVTDEENAAIDVKCSNSDVVLRITVNTPSCIKETAQFLFLRDTAIIAHAIVNKHRI